MMEDVPCVNLSNGFGGTKDMVLEVYALHFAENGIDAIALITVTLGPAAVIPGSSLTASGGRKIFKPLLNLPAISKVSLLTR